MVGGCSTVHIAEGILDPGLLVAGGALALLGVGRGLRQVDVDEMPRVAVLSSAFFVASLIHVPAGPASVHLVLNGLLGIVLGWAAFPAILIGLILQAVLFGHGGLTTLGVNTFTIASGAIAAHYLFRASAGLPMYVRGLLAGGMAVVLSAGLTASALVLTGKAFWPVALAFAGGYVPLSIIEGVISAFAVAFLFQVRPEMLPARRTRVAEEASRA
jgi:cobalt/nickel transport system permease protein